ncbi:fimbrillin family protein [Bacteroides mediterraneensis]|uniref:Fimbrillin family protein n=1 Tax=Bacteroides mediterraneensis TaxID=1841856 RepID=A0ABS2ET83_9BACE|nr:fimbrillin family protein [Bacteroides mediterraneensis]MBM6757719.1 fimbrillin family protein [Bacteroides mediterraneensis]
MNLKIQLILLLLLCTLSCCKESSEKISFPWFIEGTAIIPFSASSRTYTTEQENILAGSSLTLYSQGGLQAEAVELSYNGTRWEGSGLPKWENTSQKATLTAFCPPFNRNQSVFYQDGQLCDQLIAQEECTYGESIHLSFRHLFAQIRFTVSSRLNQQLSQMEFIPSVSVTDINPETGEVICQPTATTLCMEKSKDREYTFLLPPATLSIQIRIHTADGTVYESTLEDYPFQSGHTYICPIKRVSDDLGISSVEDFIAFTHLINGETYGQRTLEEFGEKTGETMTYYLNEDLNFSPEEAALVQMIGEYGTAASSEKRLFKDTFDGQGHSLTNLRFEQSVNPNYYAGLFSGLSATGVVKNLTLNQAIYNKNSDTKKAAFLVGFNQGEINHCTLRDCTIECIPSKSSFACLTAWNEGTIVNCHVDRVELKSELPQGNALTRYNQGGTILNCAATDCLLNKVTTESGLLCNICEDGTIQNCYIKAKTGASYSHLHPICLTTRGNTLLRCCYYSSGFTRDPIGSPNEALQSDSIIRYGSITEEKELLPKILNQWILDSGKRLFPHLTFCLWKKGETLPAVLVSP